MSQGFAFFGTCPVLGADCAPHSRQFSFPHLHICSSFRAAKATADGEHCLRVQHPKMCPQGPALPAQLAAPCRGETDFIIPMIKGNRGCAVAFFGSRDTLPRPRAALRPTSAAPSNAGRRPSDSACSGVRLGTVGEAPGLGRALLATRVWV